jgi:hypothetical protein
MNAIGQPPLDWLVNRLVLIALLRAKAPLVAPITYFAAVHEFVAEVSEEIGVRRGDDCSSGGPLLPPLRWR